MKKILLTSILALGVGVSAQVSGVKTIGTDYSTLASAFADLNAQGVGSGGVIINVPAGYTETAPAGGFLLGSATLNGTLNSTNTLVIQKSGTGANPLFTGNTGTSTTVDAIFKFSGVDYMTLDGLDLKENSANVDATTLNERGFAFYNLSGTDGCNYNTIKNSTITFLKTVNNIANGIIFTHTDAAGAAVTVTSADGTNSYNKVYSNTIVKSLASAINFTGFAATAPYTLYDQGNDIGGTSAATANTLTDFGGLAGGSFYITSYGIQGAYQNNANISNNIINFSPDGLGTVGVYTFGTNANFTVNNNTINATGQTYSLTPSVHAGIYSNAAGTNLTANNNIINVAATTFNGVATVNGINFVSTGTLNATGNTITASGPSIAYGVYSASTAATVNISNNTLRNIISSGASYNASAVYLAATGVLTTISGNKISNVSSNGATSSAYGVYVGGATASTTTNVYNNLIGDIKTPAVSSTAVSLAGIYLASTGATSNLNLYYNTVNLNATSTGTNFNSTGIYHTYNTNAATAALNLRNNIVVNTSTPNGSGTASALRRSAATNLNNYATTSNNNNFAVAATGFVYYNGTTKYNYADFLTHVTARETNSLNVTPTFATTNGTDADYLKLNVNAVATQSLDNKGADITGYTTDFAGVTRNAATPDLGAYEFTYVAPTVAPGCTTITAPTNTATGVTPNPATITWTAAANATSYKLYLGTTPGGTDIVNGTAITSLSYSASLVKNTTYYVKVVPSNNIGDATGCTEISFTTGAYVYCPITFGTVEPISRVTFAGIDNITPSAVGTVNGYQDFTNLIGQVNQNTSYPIGLKGNTDSTTSTTYTNYFIVFIDWNQNGVLNDAGEVYFSNGTVFLAGSNGDDASPYANGTIAVPATAKLGQTRMRVKKEYSGSVPSATGNFVNPCDKVQNFGQAEDYTINVSADPTMAVSDVNKANISVYPNPFTDVLKISDVKGVKSISINDMSGRQVKSLAPSAEINLSSLNAGLYIVNLQMEDGSVKTFKAIKK